MDAGIIIAQGETLLEHAAMQHDERLRLVALLCSFFMPISGIFPISFVCAGHLGSYCLLLGFP